MATRPPDQLGLFGTPLACAGIENLPLIVAPQGQIEVLAPGSLWQPLLLSPRQDRIDVGPGTLDAHEEAFYRDLIRFLYPAGDHPKSAQTPLRWGQREIWLKRNIEKHRDSFRLRVDDSDWFYPDFTVWIIDPRTRTQTYGFVDPKGLTLGAGRGWGDYKVVSTLYQPYCVEQQLAASGQRVMFADQHWRFRVRGLLVSTSALASLVAQSKFQVHAPDGALVDPSEADFQRGRIVFQQPGTAYIEAVLRLLTEDTALDRLLAQASLLFSAPEYFRPAEEADYDLALRHAEHTGTEAAFVAALLRDYLRPDATGAFGGWVRQHRRGQLLDYTNDGRFGLGGEKAAAIRDHPRPCEALYLRKFGAP